VPVSPPQNFGEKSMSVAESTQPATRTDASYEWKAVLIVSLAFGLVGLDRFILPPLFR